ncbi:retrovirus-related pol polyprotein from transposon TNT 1-94 [Tanacetum coccineum]
MVFKNKKYELGTVIRNKARLVAHGYSQEEGIDYDEISVPFARMESIRIFLSYATYINFKVFQMDVKSAFLNEKLKEEVYVKQPTGFESSEFPNYVCELDKALNLLSSFRTILLEERLKNFEKPMTKKSKMSMMGELTYFLEFQIKQDHKGISICQEKYTKDLLKKYEVSDVALVKTPMVPPNNLGPDLSGKPANPKESHIIDVKRIFMYLKGTPSLGLWYQKCSRFNLKGYSDSDYAGCNMDRKSTSGACQLLEGNLVCWSTKKQQSVVMSSVKAEYVVVVGCCVNILWIKS